MERSATRDIVVGLFVLAGLAAIAYLSLSVGGFSFSKPDGMTLYASFDEIGGLKARSPVVISGVRVGEVVDIALDESQRARVRMSVDKALLYPADSSASIVTSGVLGDRYVLLQLGGDPQGLQDGDSISFTESAILLERMIGKLIHNSDVGDSN